MGCDRTSRAVRKWSWKGCLCLVDVPPLTCRDFAGGARMSGSIKRVWPASLGNDQTQIRYVERPQCGGWKTSRESWCRKRRSSRTRNSSRKGPLNTQHCTETGRFGLYPSLARKGLTHEDSLRLVTGHRNTYLGMEDKGIRNAEFGCMWSILAEVLFFLTGSADDGDAEILFTILRLPALCYSCWGNQVVTTQYELENCNDSPGTKPAWGGK